MAARRDRPRAASDPARRAAQPWWQRAAVAAWAALVVVAVLAVVFIWPGRSQATLRPTPGQNVLLITIDTLRADALGSYGGPAATPALDRLAADGVRFEFAHAHAVMTLASHASILTGQYPFQHGVRDNSGYRLPRDARTAATLFKQAGYATAAFVGAFPVHARFGLNAGFDVYDDRFGDALAASELAMHALGIAYARAGRRDDAQRVFERLLTVLPGSSAPLENLGVLALEQGDVAGAAQYFDRAIAAAPNSSRAHAGSAAAALQRGDRGAACDAFARAVRLDPSNLEALFSLGVTLARDGRMDEARPYLDQFLQSAPPARYADQRRAVSKLLAGVR